MNYESMSEFEINKAAFLLAAKLGLLDFEDVMQNKNPDSDAVMYGDGANWYAWNGCNNASDAWPIIVAHSICIEKRSRLTDFWVAITWHQISGNEYRPIHQHSDKNPLRAAMIVFLMMSES